MKMKKVEWEDGFVGNKVLGKTDDKFYISYQGTDGLNETAIVVNSKEERTRYYILDGDWRDEYKEAYPRGLEACLDVFRNNQEAKSGWSNDLEEEEAK